MTAQNENNENTEKQKALNSLLRIVESIDKSIEDILDAINEHVDRQDYEPMWDNHDYYNHRPC